MIKRVCNRCGADDFSVMYGTDKWYVAFGEYIYPDGDLCGKCEMELDAFLAGHAVPAVEERQSWRPLTRRELRAIKRVGKRRESDTKVSRGEGGR